jgi:hypothetical protein
MQEVQVLRREFVQKKGQRLEDFVRQAMKEASVYDAASSAEAVQV